MKAAKTSKKIKRNAISTTKKAFKKKRKYITLESRITGGLDIVIIINNRGGGGGLDGVEKNICPQLKK